MSEPTYLVVVNAEGQHSVWLDGSDVPAGWVASGASGTRSECLSFIESVWTDMRPLSSR